VRRACLITGERARRLRRRARPAPTTDLLAVALPRRVLPPAKYCRPPSAAARAAAAEAKQRAQGAVPRRAV